LVPAISLLEQWVRDGTLHRDGDVAFRVAFSVLSLVARVGSARYQLWNAIVALGLFVGYVLLLFVRLR